MLDSTLAAIKRSLAYLFPRIPQKIGTPLAARAYSLCKYLSTPLSSIYIRFFSGIFSNSFTNFPLFSSSLSL